MLKKYYLLILAALIMLAFSKESNAQSAGFGVYYNSPSLKVALGSGPVIGPHPGYIYYYDGHHKRHRRPNYTYYTHPGWFHHERHFRERERHERGHERHERHERHGRH